MLQASLLLISLYPAQFQNTFQARLHLRSWCSATTVPQRKILCNCQISTHTTDSLVQGMASVLYADYAASGYLLFNLLMTVASGAVFGINELKGKGFKYSKFAGEGKLMGSIPSKVAMFLYYAPAAALSGLVLFQTTRGFPAFGPFQDYHPSLRFLALNTAIFVHFSKRVLEVLFLHKYSGNAELLSSVPIIIFYAYFSGNLLYAQKVCDQLTPPAVNLLPLGVVLFLVGIGGNFYHHYLLAQLRSGTTEKGEKKYVVPHGGLFELVTCPHYLFEIIDFCGLAMISQSTLSFATFSFVAVYLTSRSISTKKWYLKKIDGFPRDRKAILPFIL